ncbi:hypothetical protein [Xanthomonas sp. BRIP62411]|uniref:hypothetical protein n=1 Tax=Xanthomonas sp. BRIP62411 TaxID=2182389 RepID=UPI000F8EDACA|nr:hypothetical protein [Xanthomonas sp. BRIP62411]
MGITPRLDADPACDALHDDADDIVLLADAWPLSVDRSGVWPGWIAQGRGQAKQPLRFADPGLRRRMPPMAGEHRCPNGTGGAADVGISAEGHAAGAMLRWHNAVRNASANPAPTLAAALTPSAVRLSG